MDNPFQLILSRLDALGSEIKKIGQRLPEAKSEISDLGGIELACDVTGLKRSTIYSLTSKRLIPHFRRGKKLVFSIKALRLWQTENAVPTMQETKNNLRIGKGR